MSVVYPKILVVEESGALRAAMRDALRVQGYKNIVQAGTAADAYRSLNLGGTGLNPGGLVDLIILGFSLPDQNGLEVCQVLSNAAGMKEIPIIMIAAPDELANISAAFAAGVMDFLPKDFAPWELQARVYSALLLKHQTDRRKVREREALEMAGKLAAANQELRILSSADGLTGVPNRRYFNRTLSREWRRSMRSGTQLSLAKLDVDHFKAYNDHHGHLIGDDCLKRVAAGLFMDLQRAGDLFARFGGDKFVALMPGTDLQGAGSVARGMRNRVRGMAIPHEKSATADIVTVSLGVVCQTPVRGSLSDTILSAVNQALVMAKEQGGDRVVLAPPPDP